MFGDLEKTRGEIRWRFGEDVFGDLEKTYLAILGENLSAFWRNRSAILEKSFGDFGENHLALALDIWRNLFGEIVVGDLEKSFGDFGENCSAISYWRSLWSITMLGDRTRRLKHNGEKE